MEPVGFREVERQVVGQDAVPQLGLCKRHCIMCLGQLRNVVGARNHRVLEDLNCADLQHVQNDLGIFRIVFIPTVVQGFTCAGEPNRRNWLLVEPCNAEVIHQHAMIVADCLNGQMRDELLNDTLFLGLDHAREKVTAWVDDYNNRRTHSALAYQTPAVYAVSLSETRDRLRNPDKLRRSHVGHIAP